jgi:protein lifeguard
VNWNYLTHEFLSVSLDPNQQQFYGQSPYPPAAPGGFQQPGYPPQQPGYPQQQFGGFPQNPQPGYNPAYPHQQPNYNPQQPPYMDPEDPDAKNFDFSDESIRKGFIKKVYSILTVQLSITLGIIALFVFHKPTQLWVKQHPYMIWVALGIVVVTMIALACCESVRRTSPMNFVVLAVFTLAESFMLGCMSVVYDPDLVMMAVGLTAAVCLGLTLFAFQTKLDFTVMGGVLFVAAIILMVFGIVAMFFPGKTITLVYASFGALLFSIYLVYDTQMMMGK